MNTLIVSYIYLLQEREFIKTNENIFKVGMTKKENYGRFNQYPKGSILLFQMICNDCSFFEKKIIKIFKNEFIHRKDIGNEYFECKDYNIMIDIIYSTIKNDNNKYDNKDDNKINGNTNNETKLEFPCKNIKNLQTEHHKCPQYIIEQCNYIKKIKTNNKKYKCNICVYNSNNKFNYDKHLSSKKHITKISKKIYSYNCNMCNYHSSNKCNYYKHMKSIKHLMNVNYTNNKLIEE